VRKANGPATRRPQAPALYGGRNVALAAETQRSWEEVAVKLRVLDGWRGECTCGKEWGDTLWAGHTVGCSRELDNGNYTFAELLPRSISPLA
jgi:hypothetical protein